MSGIIIQDSPINYWGYLKEGDRLGNGNGIVDSKEEAAASARAFYQSKPTAYKDYQKFLNYLEEKGYNLRPRLANEATLPIAEALKTPGGKRATIMTARPSYSFDLTGNRRSHNNRDRIDFQIRMCKESPIASTNCLNYRIDGRYVIPLYLYQHPSRRKKEPVPVVSGIGFRYAKSPKRLSEATHIQFDVKGLTTRRNPKTKGFIILEIFDADGRSVSVRRSKNRKNRWLPDKNVDLFKVRIPFESTGRWQRLTVPLSKFIDWNRKRPACAIPDPGVNENIGDGTLNLDKGESFQLQIILEAEAFDKRFGAYIGERVRFVKFEN